jgi:hypothetical protein
MASRVGHAAQRRARSQRSGNPGDAMQPWSSVTDLQPWAIAGAVRKASRGRDR